MIPALLQQVRSLARETFQQPLPAGFIARDPRSRLQLRGELLPRAAWANRIIQFRKQPGRDVV